MKSNKWGISLIVIISCLIMGVIDAIIQPGYATKSIIKIGLFLVLPILYSYFNRECNLIKVLIPNKKGIKRALVLGILVYCIILASYLIFKDVFDFSSVTTSLSDGVGVNKGNFIWVAIYISFVNSLLEEFFFRGFAFFSLKEVSSRKVAYIFSSSTFALYHISMMIGWFGLEIIGLAILGLFIGGIIFNVCNEKSGNIYISWLVHMFANFSINTIGLILFGIL